MGAASLKHLENCYSQPASVSRQISTAPRVHLTLAQEEAWKKTPYGSICEMRKQQSNYY
jgi:hypothetical protein